MLADYHIHTEFSDDSEESMEDVIRQAVSLGLDEICFTDHVDYGIKIDHDKFREMSNEERQKIGKLLNVDYPKYFNGIGRLKEQYKEQIKVKSGLEFGVQEHTIPQFQKVFEAYPLDFVILSCHQVEDKEFWTYDFQKGRTRDEYNERYYQEIYNCICQYSDYSVLGHLDMIQRYNDPKYPFTKSKGMIEKILEKVIADRRGIEVNTSSFRYGLSDLMPARNILELYHDMGGKIITIGSDCHKVKDVGEYVTYVKAELKGMGYTCYCTFENMTPIFHEL